MFVPSVTTQLKITVNEGNSLIQCHDSEDSVQYEPLLKLPTKGMDSLRPLKYVLENIEELRDQFIDLLVVVTFVRLLYVILISFNLVNPDALLQILSNNNINVLFFNSDW